MYFGFFIIFFPYNAAMNLASVILADVGLGSLGFILVGTRYFLASVFGLFGPIIYNKLGTNMSLVIGGIGYWLFIVASTIPSWKKDYPDEESTFQKDWFVIFALFLGTTINGVTTP